VTVTLPKRSLTRDALLILTCVVTLTIYIYRVVAVYLAGRLADSSQVADLERAIRLVPDDPELPHLLGLQLSASGQIDNDNGAVANLRKTVSLNPYIARYWLDLASVYQAAGNVEKADEAIQSALNAEPGNPEVAAEAAQDFLHSGELDRAWPLFRQALAQNPQAAEDILPVCWHEMPDVNLLLARVIPESPELQLAFLRMLAAQKETAAANQVWQNIVAANKSFDPQLSFFYFEYLLKEHEVAAFDRARHELAALSPSLQSYLPNNNLVVNGGFEQPLSNSGLEWRYEPAEHITVGIDDNVAHSGAHSLSFSYDGNPAYDAGWTQFVPVQPNVDYDFSAWIKSENVTSSSGPRIVIVDAYSGANLLLTDDVLDTHPWQEIKGSLRVPEGTELLAVKFVRAPANTRIRGRVWIDDLRLVKR
jgi:tetratricopeptide (TPR) repeat protein